MHEASNFIDFINEDKIYVDKTECILNLIKAHKRIFFSRPRRFGKSLTLDTIATLFERGVDPYFKSTFIYDKWNEKTYPVLRLNFLDFSCTDLNDFNQDFSRCVSSFVRKQKIESFVPGDSAYQTLNSLFDNLDDDFQFIVIIDAYDRPLSANINNVELYNAFQENMRSMYAVLKGKVHIKFMAISGVTRLKDVSIFSVGSDIEDLSYSTSISTIVGFTRKEIKKYFIDYLILAVALEKSIEKDAVTDEQIESLIDRLAVDYNGYCFDEFNENKVFSTFSVSNFFSNLAEKNRLIYGDYWYDNGGLPSILVNYLKTHRFNEIDFVDKDIRVDYDSFQNPTSLLNIDQNVLMCQTGYLTLKSSFNENGKLLLGTPNNEVKKALLRILSVNFFGDVPDVFNSNNINIIEFGTADEIIKFFNSVFNTITYDNYPIKDEASVKLCIQMYLIGARQDVKAETHQAKGRTDIVIDYQDRRVVLELKFAKSKAEEPSLLHQAIEQIESRDYGNILPIKRNVMRIAAVFNQGVRMNCKFR